MSKFWKANESSDSESESSDESEVEVKQRVPQPVGRFSTFGDNSESESDDDGARVVKSAKDRTWDTLKDIVKKIKNAMKTNDWPKIQDEFDELNKKIDKSKMLIMQHGLPKFYVKILSEVADFILETSKDKDAITKMKSSVKQAFNQMKSQVRKHNENYKTEIAHCKANPDEYETEEEDEKSSEDESSESESASESSSDSDDSSDDSFSGDSDSDSDFDSDDEESDDEDGEKDDGELVLKGRLKWMKIEALIALMPQYESILRKKKGGEQQRVPRKSSKGKEKTLDQDKENRKTQGTTSTWAIDKNVTEEMLDKKLKEIIGSRGRKGTNVKETIRSLEVLAKVSRYHGPRKEIPVLMYLIAALFDAHKSIDDYMELQVWRTAYRYFSRILSQLDGNKSIVLGVMDDEEITDIMLGGQPKKGVEEMKDEPVKPIDNGTGPIKIVGSLEAILIRLDEEYTKSLQQINPHTQEYVVRLADEASLMELSNEIFTYYCRVKDFSAAANAALLYVEHIYYKHNSIAIAVQRAHLFNKTWGQYKDLHPASLGTTVDKSKVGDVTKCHPAAFSGNPTVNPAPNNASTKLEEFCHFIFKYGDDRSKARALLCTVYHKALHDDFYAARDMFLISHIQDTVDKMDVKTQILYNRTLVTLGLCAFRLNLVAKAHDCLFGICTNRLKELLAQGQAKFFLEKDREQEKIERRRQLPYHMHINPDLVECCHLISAMLLELPSIAKAGGVVNNPSQVISRQFRRYFQIYLRQVFTGPPENTREQIFAAAKALLNGEWKKARDSIVNLESWNLLPGDGAEKVKSLLRDRIKEEGVRIYLLTYGAHFESMCLSHVCEMFEMEDVAARRIISRMIFDKEISAAWEHPADTLILYKVDPSPVQTLSQTVAEKVSALMESNERLLDPFSGMYGYKDERDNQYNRDNRKQYGDDKQGRKQWTGKQGSTGRSSHPRLFTGRGNGRGRGNAAGGRSNVWSAGRRHSMGGQNKSQNQGGNFEQTNPLYTRGQN